MTAQPGTGSAGPARAGTAEPRVVTTRAALAAALVDRPARRAVVMTMGALHAGHLTLVREARSMADQVVVTIFVNPLQFGPSEDLQSYPRDLVRDVELLAAAGADLVFAPTVDEVYLGGAPVVRVTAGGLGELWEGAQRPGHFDGVLTVVLKLLHLIRPDVALFGQKDAQQLMAVRRMVRDLDVGVDVVAVPTVRDPDGVALSSRNAYLGPDDRPVARTLSQSLHAGRAVALAGGGGDAVLAATTGVLAAQTGLVVDYAALMDPVTARSVADGHRGEAVLAVAGRVGSTRLIDNVVLELVGDQGQEEDR